MSKEKPLPSQKQAGNPKGLVPFSAGSLRWFRPTDSDRETVRRRCCINLVSPNIPENYVWQALPWDYRTSKEDWKAWHIKNNVEGPYIPQNLGAELQHIEQYHMPRVKQRLTTSKIDQRLDTFLLSNEYIEELSEDYFGEFRLPKISKLLIKYNEGLDNTDLVNYNPITRDQIRDAYKRRFPERMTSKIDKFIEKWLDRILKPNVQSIQITPHDVIITEKLNPGHFIYNGTERILLKGNDYFAQKRLLREDERLFNKWLEYFRAKQSPKFLKAVTLVENRTYNVGSEIKRISFVIRSDRLYISGDELNERFRNFFLLEAIRRKRINNTTKDKNRFLALFDKNNGFIKLPTYDVPLEERQKYREYVLSHSYVTDA
jgi:hypothetical protein